MFRTFQRLQRERGDRKYDRNSQRQKIKPGLIQIYCLTIRKSRKREKHAETEREKNREGDRKRRKRMKRRKRRKRGRERRKEREHKMKIRKLSNS